MHSFIYSVAKSIVAFPAYASKPSCACSSFCLMLSAIQKCDLSSDHSQTQSLEPATGSMAAQWTCELFTCFSICQSHPCQPWLRSVVLSQYNGRRNHLGKRNSNPSRRRSQAHPSLKISCIFCKSQRLSCFY